MSIHPFGATATTRAEALRVLDAIQRLAVEQLGGIPGALFGPVEDALNTAAEREEQLPYLDQAALRVLRQRHATHVMHFRQQIAQGFDDFRARRLRARPDAQMELIEETQLELHLAGQRVAESVEQQCARALEPMSQYLAALARDLGLPVSPNPIAPSQLTAAFMRTFADEQISHGLRVLMLDQYEHELLRVSTELYARVNGLLTRSGYAIAPPSPAVSPARPVDAPAVDGPKAGASSASARPMPAATGVTRPDIHDGAAAVSFDGMPAGQADQPAAPSELAELRSKLHAWRNTRTAANDETAAPRPTSPASRFGQRQAVAPRRELQVAEVVTVASLLQSEPTESFARALAGSGRLADTIRAQLNDGSRRLGMNPEQIRFSEDEEDAIDLVALLFDSLFECHRLHERARRLYSRLVLPIVKVALTDQTLFVSDEHPARRLLDAITEACDGNCAETPQERELLARAAAASQRVVAEFNEDLAIFEVAHAELDALLQQQRRRSELQEERAAKATSGRERLSHAREQADLVLSQRLATSQLSPAIADFLVTPWRHHLAQTLLRDGEGAGSHIEAVALGEALVVADRLAAYGDGVALAEHMLALEPAIIACLASSGLDEGAAQHGMAVLVRGLAYPDTPRQLHPLPPPQANNEDIRECSLWLAGGTDTVAHDPQLAERMRQLKPGDWLQLVDAQGETSSAKVAWVSPLTGRRLLVNRRGIRVLVASAEDLAALAGSGRLTLGVELAAFSEAMRNVRQQLDCVAA